MKHFSLLMPPSLPLIAHPFLIPVSAQEAPTIALPAFTQQGYTAVALFEMIPKKLDSAFQNVNNCSI